MCVSLKNQGHASLTSAGNSRLRTTARREFPNTTTTYVVGPCYSCEFKKNNKALLKCLYQEHPFNLSYPLPGLLSIMLSIKLHLLPSLLAMSPQAGPPVVLS
jgi:hypothetical protein